MPQFLAHLEAAIDGTILPAGKLANLHNGRPIWVRYHLDRIRAAVSPADIAGRTPPSGAIASSCHCRSVRSLSRSARG